MNSIKIGGFTLVDPVILAPMSGVTDAPFRSIVRELGAGLLVSEMIASRAMIIQTRQSLQKAKVEEKTSVQLAGFEPEVMAEAAKLSEDLGAQIIDINFGCPVKKVVNGHAGSALMRDEIRAAAILNSVVRAVKIPVTLKMRTGWDYDNRNAPRLAKIAEDVGIQMIVVHGRTRSQLYSGKADWKFIRNVKESVKIPIIVNGDIKSCTDINTALTESGADGIMIGRGVYGKPWIISQAISFLKTGSFSAEPTNQQKFDIIQKHFNLMIEHYGDTIGINMAKKHMSWYSAGLFGSPEFRAKINMIDDLNDARHLVTDFFTSTLLN